MTDFGKIRKFDGKKFKLATLHKGVTKKSAEKTAEMNRAENKYARVVEMNGKYATYVKEKRG